MSADMRDLAKVKAAGDVRAALQSTWYVAHICEAIGAMAAALGSFDASTFADGMGEHDPDIRAAIIAPLVWLGVALDDAANAQAQPDVDVAVADSRVRVLVIRTRETLMVAREVRRVLARVSGRQGSR